MHPLRPTEMCHLQITFPVPGADHSSPTQEAMGKQLGQGLEAPGTFTSTSVCISTFFGTPHIKTQLPMCPAQTLQLFQKGDFLLFLTPSLQVPKKGSHSLGLGQVSASGPITVATRSGHSVHMTASYGNHDDPTTSGNRDIKRGDSVF